MSSIYIDPQVYTAVPSARRAVWKRKWLSMTCWMNFGFPTPVWIME